MDAELPTFEYQQKPWFTAGFIVLMNVVTVVVLLIDFGISLGLIAGGAGLIAAGAEAGKAVYIIIGAVLLALALFVLILMHPIVQANPLVTYLAKRGFPVPYDRKQSVVVQVTFRPRTSTGVAAVLDDADDIGVLTLEETRLSFYGSNTRFTIPYHAIQKLESTFLLFPVPFVTGRVMGVYYGDGPNVGRIRMHRRDTWLSIDQITKSLSLIRRLQERVPHVEHDKMLIRLGMSA